MAARGEVLRPYSLGPDPYAAGQHRGVDVAGSAGEPVRAPAAGIVSFVGVVPSSGRTVTIQPTGYAVSLTHLGEITVAKGATVAEGDAVGIAGQSGEAEWPTPYVHLGIRVSRQPTATSTRPRSSRRGRWRRPLRLPPRPRSSRRRRPRSCAPVASPVRRRRRRRARAGAGPVRRRGSRCRRCRRPARLRLADPTPTASAARRPPRRRRRPGRVGQSARAARPGPASCRGEPASPVAAERGRHRLARVRGGSRRARRGRGAVARLRARRRGRSDGHRPRRRRSALPVPGPAAGDASSRLRPPPRARTRRRPRAVERAVAGQALRARFAAAPEHAAASERLGGSVARPAASVGRARGAAVAVVTTVPARVGRVDRRGPRPLAGSSGPQRGCWRASVESMAMERYYVTTPIYYVNSTPHIGHAYTTIAADILARHQRQRGVETFFLTGVDEHAAKVARVAAEQGLSPQEYADQIAVVWRELPERLNASNDFFIRTSDEEHKRFVQGFLQKLYDNGHVYQDVYAGLYCVGCEAFKTEADLVDGKCPEHDTRAGVDRGAQLVLPALVVPAAAARAVRARRLRPARDSGRTRRAASSRAASRTSRSAAPGRRGASRSRGIRIRSPTSGRTRSSTT